MLDDPFIDEQELLDAREYVNLYIKKNMNWREGFMHRRIYNEVNYRLGVLRKVELARQSITCQSQKEIIKLLYILGYGEKQITFLLYDWGYKGFNVDQVRTHINKQKTNWNKEKEEFMAEIVNAKNSIFQLMRESVMDTERTTITIYLEKIQVLQDVLSKTDPIEEDQKFRSIVTKIERLQDLCKESHGIKEWRHASIEVESKIAIAKGTKVESATDLIEEVKQGTLI